MTLVQLDLFESLEASALKSELAEMRAAMDRQRKSQFAKIGSNTKEILELKAEMQMLKENICKLGIIGECKHSNV